MFSRYVEMSEEYRHVFDPDQPYNDLPDLPPKAELETRDVLKSCVEARAALAELKELGATIPNQAVLINAIPILEAQASSEIENIVTTRDALFRHAQHLEEASDPATKEALRYRTALYLGYRSLGQRPLCTATAIDVCRTIKGRQLDVRTVPGTKLAGDWSGKVIYTPPEGEALLRNKLANWEQFLHREEELDPLVRMAVGHYQFEAIHPFSDGNGRTGRVLNILYLIEQGLLDIPVLYLSGYIIRHKSDYYRLLLAVTEDGAWEEWLRFMMTAVQRTARWTADKIRAIRDLQQTTSQYVQERLPSIYSHELVETLFVQPYCRIANIVEAGIGQRQTASNYLKKLREIGVLDEIKAGREKLFINRRYLRLLVADDNAFEPF